jgi:hypothetical protein
MALCAGSTTAAALPTFRNCSALLVADVQNLGPGDKSVGRIVMPEIADWLKTLGMSEYAERI